MTMLAILGVVAVIVVVTLCRLLAQSIRLITREEPWNQKKR